MLSFTFSRYYNYELSVNGSVEDHGSNPEDYLTTVLLRKSVQFLNEQKRKRGNNPFLMVIATSAPHQPVTPENKYKRRFNNINAPKTPSYGVNSSDKHWYKFRTFS